MSVSTSTLGDALSCGQAHCAVRQQTANFLLHLWILVPLQFRMSKPEAKKTAANCIVKDMRCEIVMMLMRCLQMNVLAASG